MGFFSRLGSRISSGLHSAARVGKKALGAVNRVGNTIAHGAEKVVNVVDRIPVVGQVLAPISGVVRSGVGLVKDVADAAGAGASLLDEGDKLLTAGEKALKSGGSAADVAAAVAQGKKVGGMGKSQLEKGGRIAKDTAELIQDVKKLTKDVSAREMRKQIVEGGRAEVKSRLRNM